MSPIVTYSPNREFVGSEDPRGLYNWNSNEKPLIPNSCTAVCNVRSNRDQLLFGRCCDGRLKKVRRMIQTKVDSKQQQTTANKQQPTNNIINTTKKLSSKHSRDYLNLINAAASFWKMSRGDQRDRDRAKSQAKQQAKLKSQGKVRYISAHTYMQIYFKLAFDYSQKWFGYIHTIPPWSKSFPCRLETL